MFFKKVSDDLIYIVVGLEDLSLHTLGYFLSTPDSYGEEDGLPKETILRGRGSEPKQGTTVIQSTNSSVEKDTFANYETFWYGSL